MVFDKIGLYNSRKWIFEGGKALLHLILVVFGKIGR
jgi:hypothetical protein